MEKILSFIVEFIVAFVVVYLIYSLFIIRNKKSQSKIKTSMEAKYLNIKYKINLDNIDTKKLSKKIALSNSFIIAIAFMIISFVKNYFLKILVGFVTLFPLMLLIYHIVGKSLQKKEGKKNV